MIRHALQFLATLLVALPWAGCDSLELSQIIVVLENDADFPVTVDIYFSDQQGISKSQLISDGQNRSFTIDEGESEIFFLSCDEAMALLADAELQGPVGIEPNDDTAVLRDSDDFNCLERITFTFEHSFILVDFNIAVNVQ